jgi:histone deacetylase 1/2
MRMAHELVSAYDLLGKMEVIVCYEKSIHRALLTIAQRPARATPQEMSSFHTDEYIHFISRVTPELADELTYHGTRCELHLSCASRILINV